MKRRDFIKSSALSAATLAMAGPALSKPFDNAFLKTMPIGLGMFTLFGVIEQDVPGTLKKVKQIGYSELESAFSMKGGYYGLTAKEFAKLTKETGLAWRSHHVLGNPFVLPPDAKVPEALKNMPKPKDLTNN